MNAAQSIWESLARRAGQAFSFLRLIAFTAFCQKVGRRRVFIILAGALVCGYAISVLAYVRSIPEIGLRFGFKTSIQHVDPSYFSSDPGVAPHPQDTIKKVGSCEVTNWLQLFRALPSLAGEKPVPFDDEEFEPEEARALPERARAVAESRGISYLSIGSERWVRVQFENTLDGSEHTTWARVETMPLRTLVPSVLWFCLKACLFLVGALVFWKRPEDRSAMQFFLLCFVTFNAFMGGYHWQRIATQPYLLLVFMASGILLPSFSLHFYLVFPRAKLFLERRLWPTLLVIYGIPLPFLVILSVSYLRVRGMPEGDSETILEHMKVESDIYFGVAALWYIACVVSLLHSFVTAITPIERNQVKCILFGAMASLVPIGYTLYLAFVEPENFGSGAGTWPMFAASVCLNLAFAISITRYRLMQLDQLISSSVVYFLFSSAAGLVYYVLVFAGMVVVGSQVIARPSLSQALWASSTSLVLMLVLDLVRGRLKKALDHRFRREKYQLDRTLRRMSQAIEQLVEPLALARRLLQVSGELMGVPRGAVFLREGNPPLYRLADSLGLPPPLTELSPGCPLIEALPVCGTMVAHPRPLLVAESAHRQMQFLGGELAHPLIHEGQMLALLVLGPREVGNYSADDLNIVAAFAHMTALALASAEGHRTIEFLNHDLQAKVAKIAEQQRRITVLQSQLLRQSRDSSGIMTPAPGVDGSVAPGAGQGAQEASTNGDAVKPETVKPGGFVGSSLQVRELLGQVRKISASASAVLLRGESGTGKEVLARTLHEASPRAGKAFVKVHCAALSPTLLESELFGHVKGAFTGAHRDKIGRFELAHGGTLFLDEIGDITLEVQTKLLRVLQEKTIERVGSNQPVEVDVRLISATHQDLETFIKNGRFREDLYYRLNVISIAVPPLRNRCEDIPELANHFLRLYATRCAKEVPQIDDDVLVALKSYSWPGNIRQLENVMERAVVIAEGTTITLEELAPEILQGSTEPDEMLTLWKDEEPTDLFPRPTPIAAKLDLVLRDQRDQREREQLVRALSSADGNKAEAARALGIARSTLFSKLRKYGLS